MKLNSIDDIYIVSNKLVPVSPTQFDRARVALGTEFPQGFVQFMLKFGKGDLSGYLRPYDPDRITGELASNREWFAKDFWEDGELRLTPEERANLIPFADTIDSDAFAFLPGAPEKIFVLPRQDNRLFETGPTFLKLLNWVANSGELVRPFELGFFQPWNDNASIRLDNPSHNYDLDQMKAIFESIGAPDNVVLGEEEESIDFFIRKYGAHINYLLLDEYTQFIVSFDYEAAQEFLLLLTRALAGKGFRITEHNRVDTLPDLS
jgi:hypothetical protein